VRAYPPGQYVFLAAGTPENPLGMCRVDLATWVKAVKIEKKENCDCGTKQTG
jgi:hypothetical protein